VLIVELRDGVVVAKADGISEACFVGGADSIGIGAADPVNNGIWLGYKDGVLVGLVVRPLVGEWDGRCLGDPVTPFATGVEKTKLALYNFAAFLLVSGIFWLFDDDGLFDPFVGAAVRGCVAL
jgi:hypothetical protein